MTMSFYPLPDQKRLYQETHYVIQTLFLRRNIVLIM